MNHSHIIKQSKKKRAFRVKKIVIMQISAYLMIGELISILQAHTFQKTICNIELLCRRIVNFYFDMSKRNQFCFQKRNLKTLKKKKKKNAYVYICDGRAPRGCVLYALTSPLPAHQEVRLKFRYTNLRARELGHAEQFVFFIFILRYLFFPPFRI